MKPRTITASSPTLIHITLIHIQVGGFNRIDPRASFFAFLKMQCRCLYLCDQEDITSPTPFDVRVGRQPAFDYVFSLTQPRSAPPSRNSRIL